jgi:hypothetical protein
MERESHVLRDRRRWGSAVVVVGALGVGQNVRGGCASPTVSSLGSGEMRSKLASGSIVWLITIARLGTGEGLSGWRALVEGHSKFSHVGRG